MRDEHLIPLRKQELALGQPLRWSVYDAHGVLLLARGIVLDSQHKIDVLFEKGLYRSSRREAAHARPGVEEAAGDPSFEKTYQYRHERDRGRMTHPIARLPIGIVLSLQANADDSSERYNCRYIGYLEDKSVLVTTPISEGRLVPCRDGQNFFVRCFHGKTALAFKANILKTHLAPFPYLHLSFPKEVTVMTVRKSHRAPVDLIATVARDGDKLAVRIDNIGVGGAHCQSNKPLGSVGDQAEISFKVVLDEMETYIRTGVTIRSHAMHHEEAGNRHEYGLQFGELDREHRHVLMNLVYRASVEV